MLSIGKLVLAATMVVASMGVSSAADYPTRPVTLIVPWGAGGGTDATGRILAQLMQKQLGQPMNVVNRTGGGSVIGHTAIANAKPDGYTLGIITTELSMFHWLGQSSISYMDYTLIGLYNADPSAVVVAANSPYKSMKDLAAAIKKKPQDIRASGANAGGVNNLAYVGLVQALGLPGEKASWVPTEGAAPALQLLVSGAIDVAVVQLPEARALINSGEVRPLAYLGEKRNEDFPDVPTLKQSIGIDYTATGWRGLGGPKGLPDNVVETLKTAMHKVVTSDEFKKLMAKRQFGVEWKGGDDFRQYLKARDKSFGAALKAAGLAKQED